MKFHLKKCKVVPVSPPDKALQDLFYKIFPLTNIYFHSLRGEQLDYVNEEKDLGVLVTSELGTDRSRDFSAGPETAGFRFCFR
jgi:hypothetical protein